MLVAPSRKRVVAKTGGRRGHWSPDIVGNGLPTYAADCTITQATAAKTGGLRGHCHPDIVGKGLPTYALESIWLERSENMQSWASR
jgi:hypothetical protein